MANFAKDKNDRRQVKHIKTNIYESNIYKWFSEEEQEHSQDA